MVTSEATIKEVPVVELNRSRYGATTGKSRACAKAACVLGRKASEDDRETIVVDDVDAALALGVAIVSYGRTDEDRASTPDAVPMF